MAALTLAIRVIGGSIGYTIYYNVFINKFRENGKYYIGGVMVTKLGIKDPKAIKEAIELIGHAMLDELPTVHGLDSPAKIAAVIKAGKLAFAESYKWVYYVSIAFGAVSIVASCFLGDIS